MAPYLPVWAIYPPSTLLKTRFSRDGVNYIYCATVSRRLQDTGGEEEEEEGEETEARGPIRTEDIHAQSEVLGELVLTVQV